MDGQKCLSAFSVSLKFTADFKSDVTWPEIQVILSKKLVRCQFHNFFQDMKVSWLRITTYVSLLQILQFHKFFSST